jgi:hypothetical protein
VPPATGKTFDFQHGPKESPAAGGYTYPKLSGRCETAPAQEAAN